MGGGRTGGDVEAQRALLGKSVIMGWRVKERFAIFYEFSTEKTYQSNGARTISFAWYVRVALKSIEASIPVIYADIFPPTLNSVFYTEFSVWLSTSSN